MNSVVRMIMKHACRANSDSKLSPSVVRMILELSRRANGDSKLSPSVVRMILELSRRANGDSNVRDVGGQTNGATHHTDMRLGVAGAAVVRGTHARARARASAHAHGARAVTSQHVSHLDDIDLRRTRGASFDGARRRRTSSRRTTST